MTIAFFGATGGCTNAALVLALKAGYECAALVRTPSKLTEMLAAKGVDQSIVDSKLRMVKGDVLDAATVKTVIKKDDSSPPATTIVSGIGTYPGRNTDWNLCEKATRSVLGALRELALPAAQRPHVVFISTTGISAGPRDFPLLLFPIYHWLLKNAHKDKSASERLFAEARGGADDGGLLSGYTIVRPSLLFSGKEYGMGSIRAGTEETPAVGYYINRDDVGRWMFEACIKGDVSQWDSKRVSVTY